MEKAEWSSFEGSKDYSEGRGCVEEVSAQSRMKMLEMFLERTNRINFAENYWNKFQPIACPTAGARKDYIHQ